MDQLKTVLWYTSNFLNDHVLIDLKVPRFEVIENRRLSRVYNAVWYFVFTILALFNVLFRTYVSDMNVSQHMFSKLQVTHVNADPPEKFLDHKHFCRGGLRDYDYWLSEADHDKFQDYRCVRACAGSSDEAGSFEHPTCFSKHALSQQISDNKVLVVTHIMRTVSNITWDPSRTDLSGLISRMNFWTPAPEKERLSLFFGFTKPEMSWWNSLEGSPHITSGTDQRKTGSSSHGFDTYLLKSDGQVHRKIKAGDMVVVTMEEALHMSGKSVRWLDSIIKSAGPNKKQDAAHRAGAVARLAGGSLVLQVRCLNRGVKGFGFSLIQQSFECHVSAELVEVAFQGQNHHTLVSVLKGHLVEAQMWDAKNNGLTVICIKNGHFEYINLNNIILQLICFVVLMRIPRKTISWFMLRCLGTLSHMYHRAVYESLAVQTRVAGLLARTIQKPVQYVALADRRDTTGLLCISRQQMRQRLDAIMSHSKLHLCEDDRNKCLDYLFLMVVKAQVADANSEENILLRVKRQRQLEARIEARDAAKKKARAESLGVSVKEDSFHMGRLMNKVERKRKKFHNMIQDLDDDFSGVNLDEVKKELENGIKLGGFSAQCASVETFQLNDVMPYFKRHRSYGCLETLCSPWEFSERGINFLIEQGHTLSMNKYGGWIDEDYITLQKKLNQRKLDRIEHHAEEMRKAEEAKQKKDREREEADAEIHETELQKKQKKILAQFDEQEVHLNGLVEEYKDGMHLMYHQAAEVDMRLNQLEQEMSFVRRMRKDTSAGQCTHSDHQDGAQRGTTDI